jgi:GNAT superfamily N-acetyltransferase
MASRPGVSIREMLAADIPAGLRLCRASHWNQTDRDWEHFLTAAPGNALVAVEQGAVVGTVAALPYGSFTWISMVLVDPSARGRGIGTTLLTRGLELVPRESTARLDATPAGEVIYRKLDFVSEYGLSRLFLDSRPTGVTRGPGVRPLESSDWPALLEMDLRAFGASRASLLERLAAESPGYAWVVEDHGRLHGYLMGRHGHLRDQMGPLVADSPETARVLLAAVLASRTRHEIFIDVPEHQPEFRDRLAQLGFAMERPFLRMYRGRLTTPGTPSLVYAITGPEFG